MKIIFAGTPEFAVEPLTALLKEHHIVAVFTQPDRPAGRGKKVMASPVKQLAINNNLTVFQPDSLAQQQPIIEKLGADVMVVVAYGMLLPQAILDIPPLGCINIHASILPRWRGAAPIQRAIEAGDSETGVSIMQMERGLDTGPVYQILTTPIGEYDTSASMHGKLSILGAQGIQETLTDLSSGHLTPTAQDESQSTYARKISKSEAVIDWSLNAKEIHARIRAFYPWPICHTFHREPGHRQTRIRVSQASVIRQSEQNDTPGSIVEIHDTGLIVACGQNFVRLEVLQRDGGKALPSKEFCNGYPLDVGDRFDSSH